ncbi:MAG: hypothetical protein ABI167_10465 [Nitrosospira sp.]
MRDSFAACGKNSGENDRKLTASTRAGSESRLMDYLGLSRSLDRLAA